MTTTAQRQHLADLINQACQSGARLYPACQQISISCRTLQRWLNPAANTTSKTPAPVPTPADTATAPADTELPASAPDCAKPVGEDRRQAHLRLAVIPHNRMSDEEREAFLAEANSDKFKDLPPSQIVPRLADEGRYLGSESTLHRLLRETHQNTPRCSTRPAQKRHKPFALAATAVNQVYTWDITYLPTTVKGQFFYMYVFVDIFSRYIVGAQVFESESAELSADLLKDICLRHGVDKNQVHLHSDNGGPMKGQTMLAMMQELGVIASRSRPAVSNDNPYSESLFGTIKHRPLMPVRPFDSIEAARNWAILLVDWYNQEHRHSGIKFVTPAQRHQGQDVELLQKRDALYAQHRAKHPERWSGNTRNWNPVPKVLLNPDKPELKECELTQK